MEETSAKQLPDLHLCDLRFALHHGTQQKKEEAKKALLESIKANHMAPLYELICADLKISPDATLLLNLKKENEKQMTALNEKMKDAEENLGETEISDCLLEKANYLVSIGHKDQAIEAFNVAFEKTASLGSKIDMVFTIIRIGFFFNDVEIISKNIEKAKILIEKGGDWDRRNRLKVYNGLYHMTIRDFKNAANLFLDGISTFTSSEVLSYKQFIMYTVLMGAFALKRVDLKKKIVNAPEVLEVLHDSPDLGEFVNSLHNCQYAHFFSALAKIENQLKNDRLLFKHYHFFVREMRIIAYAQLLESYQSVTIESMSHSFGVSEEFIDRDLSRFISLGRLHCVIDKVGGIVETNRPDCKNAQYQACIKQGDLLLNRIQKLSRVINV